mmetsp:Transcript_63928/g.202276  ORF Transcript_63928/g.202276 Transcript_63928/m.202276 type:complete len:211 (+) Transcript_63928:2-634(+)
MGFPDAACREAVGRFGEDMDRAVNWLVNGGAADARGGAMEEEEEEDSAWGSETPGPSEDGRSSAFSSAPSTPQVQAGVRGPGSTAPSPGPPPPAPAPSPGQRVRDGRPQVGLEVLIEKVGIKDPKKMLDPFFTVSLRGPEGQLIEAAQDTGVAAQVVSKFLIMNHTVAFKMPVAEMRPGTAVFLELVRRPTSPRRSPRSRIPLHQGHRLC